MIDPESAAALIAAVARGLNPHTSPDGPDSEVEALHALARRATWVADVASAEARRREAAYSIALQVQISQEGVEAERAHARDAAARLRRLMREAELRLADLMNERPVD